MKMQKTRGLKALFPSDNTLMALSKLKEQITELILNVYN